MHIHTVNFPKLACLEQAVSTYCKHVLGSLLLLPAAALTQRLQLSVADACSDLERHSSLKSSDLRYVSGLGHRSGQVPASPKQQTPQTSSGRSSALSSPRDGSQRRRQPAGSVQSGLAPARGSAPKRPSFSSDASPSGQRRQAAWE